MEQLEYSIDASSTEDVDLSALTGWFHNFRSVLVALSSGVDSALLAKVARDALGKQHSLAVTSVSPALSLVELSEAKRIAKEIDIELVLVSQDDLASPSYVLNGVNRCYFCRSNLAEAIKPIVKARNIDVCIDGTHIEDLKTPRPGIRALRETGFRAPYCEIGLTKEDIRRIARSLHLSNAEKPSESCLASRIAYGQEIDLATLRLVERAEEEVRKITGAKVVRVRTIGKTASVEVERDSLTSAWNKRPEIESTLMQLGYASVRVDPNGYTPGKMLSLFAKNEAE